MMTVVVVIVVVAATVVVVVVVTTCICCMRHRVEGHRSKLSPTRTEYNVNYVHVRESSLQSNMSGPAAAPSQSGIHLPQTMSRWPLLNGSASAAAGGTTSPWQPLIDVSCQPLAYEVGILIAREQLHIRDVIGQGNFGCVYHAFLLADDKSETEVAVKTMRIPLDNSGSCAVEVRRFIDEALRMKEFDHPNVLSLIGVALDFDSLPLVVLPFMRHGDLLSYIRNEAHKPTVRQLISFAVQIAQGMAYLSSLKFVHRDLAARNCMLDNEMHVKVADFGLSRDIYERDYYSSDNRKSKLPVKWMALESLEKGIYNSKTDVWSYGVVLWELMTRGVGPYPDVDNWDIVTFLRNGRRLSQPPYCPDALYDIMQRCWHVHAWRRPSFDQLVTETSAVITAMMHSRRHSSTRSSVVVTDRDAPTDVGRPSVSAPDAVGAEPPTDYLLPTPRCSDCARRDDDPWQPDQPSDGDVHGRRTPPPQVVYDRPTSTAVYQVPPPASPVDPDTDHCDQLPWRCTAV